MHMHRNLYFRPGHFPLFQNLDRTTGRKDRCTPVEEDEVLLQQHFQESVEELEDLREDEKAGPNVEVRVDEVDLLGLGADRVAPTALRQLSSNNKERAVSGVSRPARVAVRALGGVDGWWGGAHVGE